MTGRGSSSVDSCLPQPQLVTLSRRKKNRNKLLSLIWTFWVLTWHDDHILTQPVWPTLSCCEDEPQTVAKLWNSKLALTSDSPGNNLDFGASPWAVPHPDPVACCPLSPALWDGRGWTWEPWPETHSRCWTNHSPTTCIIIYMIQNKNTSNTLTHSYIFTYLVCSSASNVSWFKKHIERIFILRW